MAHVRDEEWIDFVRGTLPAARVAVVTAHLERGCPRCLKLRNLWQSAVEMASRDRMYTPPAAAVRIAQAQFASAPVGENPPPLRALLVFDSFRNAVAAGVRGAAAAPRQLLFVAGPISVDLRLEQSDSAHTLLIGQVARHAACAADAGICRITMLKGDRQTAATSTDHLGEFELRFEPHDDLVLLVATPDGATVRLQLGES